MLLPSHKYLVEVYSGMKNTPDNKHRFIEVILRKPAPTDEFGVPFMSDDIFQCKVWNKAADDLPIFNHGDKVEATLAIRGQKIISKNGNGSIYYNTQFTIRKITKI